MALLVVGSLALDSVRTPFGERSDVLGGSSVYFSYSASFFTTVAMVGVVGEDFPESHVDLLKKRGIDTSGVTRQEGSTFRWSGLYEYDLNEAKTLETHLNVFERFRPALTEEHRDVDAVFLANIDPDLQMDVLRQVRRPQLVAADTMNLWISTKRRTLQELCRRIDILFLNDSEARQFAEVPNLIKAGRSIQSMGPKHVIIKKGEHGVLMFSGPHVFSAPAYPLEDVFDPTGAGDTFAGGVVGYLNGQGNKLDEKSLRQALHQGTVMASFTVEDFSLDRLRTLRHTDIRARLKSLREMTAPEPVEEV